MKSQRNHQRNTTKSPAQRKHQRSRRMQNRRELRTIGAEKQLQKPDRPMTPHAIEQGTQEIYRMLRNGIYVDINNKNKAVNGDFTKLRYCPGLSLTAQKLYSTWTAFALQLQCKVWSALLREPHKRNFDTV